MGVFNGIARKFAYRLDRVGQKFFGFLSLAVPVLLHGAYDYIASLEREDSGWYFATFIIALFVGSYTLVGKASQRDEYIRQGWAPVFLRSPAVFQPDG